MTLAELQFVWWGDPRDWQWRARRYRPATSMGRIYRWSLWLGPLEVRAWR